MILVLSIALIAGFGLGLSASLPATMFGLTLLGFGSAAMVGIAAGFDIPAASMAFVLSLAAGQVGYVASQAARARLAEIRVRRRDRR